MVFMTVMNNAQVQPNTIQNIPGPGSEEPAAVAIATSFPPSTGAPATCNTSPSHAALTPSDQGASTEAVVSQSSLPIRKRKQEAISNMDMAGLVAGASSVSEESQAQFIALQAEAATGLSPDALSEDDIIGQPPSKSLKRAPMSKAREVRLEQNRKAARESRRRKKIMIEELQRSVVFFSRANTSLKTQNDELQRMLLSAQSRISGFEDSGVVNKAPTPAPVPAASEAQNDQVQAQGPSSQGQGQVQTLEKQGQVATVPNGNNSAAVNMTNQLNAFNEQFQAQMQQLQAQAQSQVSVPAPGASLPMNAPVPAQVTPNAAPGPTTNSNSPTSTENVNHLLSSRETRQTEAQQAIASASAQAAQQAQAQAQAVQAQAAQAQAAQAAATQAMFQNQGFPPAAARAAAQTFVAGPPSHGHVNVPMNGHGQGQMGANGRGQMEAQQVLANNLNNMFFGQQLQVPGMPVQQMQNVNVNQNQQVQMNNVNGVPVQVPLTAQHESDPNKTAMTAATANDAHSQIQASATSLMAAAQPATTAQSQQQAAQVQAQQQQLIMAMQQFTQMQAQVQAQQNLAAAQQAGQVTTMNPTVGTAPNQMQSQVNAPVPASVGLGNINMFQNMFAPAQGQPAVPVPQGQGAGLSQNTLS